MRCCFAISSIATESAPWLGVDEDTVAVLLFVGFEVSPLFDLGCALDLEEEDVDLLLAEEGRVESTFRRRLAELPKCVRWFVLLVSSFDVFEVILFKLAWLSFRL